jgi:FAD/FMN-containing dehydrogenase
VIAKCSSPDDVVAALALAQREGHEVAVRADRHSVAGLSLNDDGLVIDVRPMKAVEVDAAGRRIRVGAGYLG